MPVLIKTKSYKHPWLGISGMSLTSDLAGAMGLKLTQRGALALDVMPGSPAAPGWVAVIATPSWMVNRYALVVMW